MTNVEQKRTRIDAGKPRKIQENKLSHALQVRVTEREYELLESYLRETRMDKPDFLRQAILGAIPKVYRTATKTKNPKITMQPEQQLGPKPAVKIIVQQQSEPEPEFLIDTKLQQQPEPEFPIDTNPKPELELLVSSEEKIPNQRAVTNSSETKSSESYIQLSLQSAMQEAQK